MATSAPTSRDNAKKMVTLRTSDGENFVVDEAVAAMSETIKKLLEDCDGDDIIPLPNVAAKTVVKVMEWCKKHTDDVGKLTEEELRTWDAEFVAMDQDTLHGVILAANYLNVKGLLDQLTERAADIVRRCKTSEEIRQAFNIDNDFAPGEEQKIIDSNAWAFSD